MNTQINLKSPIRQMEPIAVENLLIHFTTEFHRIWDNTGSKSKPGSFWRPTPAPDLLPGYFPLGDLAVSGRHNVNEQQVMAVVREGDPQHTDAGKGPALSRPEAYQRVWSDAGSGANGDCSIWQPVPPQGYVALGMVCSNDNTQPSFNAVRCVRADLVVAASAASLIWSDQGSGAARDFSTWSVTPPIASAGEIYFAPGTFIGTKGYGKPVSPGTAYALRMPIPIQVQTPPALPELSGHDASAALPPARITQVVRLPWFAVNDPALTSLAQLRTSPFYQMERTDRYVLVGEGKNNTDVNRAFRWKAHRTQSSGMIRRFTRNTGIDIGVQWQSVTPASAVICSARLGDSFCNSDSDTDEWVNSLDAEVIALVGPNRFAAVYLMQSDYRVLREDGSQVEGHLSFTDMDSLHLTDCPVEPEPKTVSDTESEKQTPAEPVKPEQLPAAQPQSEPQLPTESMPLTGTVP
ncbi:MULTISPECIES: Vps62-related protein [Pseudomonas]|uniref:Vps62-related protein n=1 Tax=Pseudomonas aphyarum TaxID=2942629 RepID=A0ABT5PPN0_9PSED|nr:Vps62-related protein [Pseudomonas aphyarum]MDD0971892.1 Vps62-related protein [Pseudomonas aphyarum]MDD1125491.1 Vps62-related protein [Pseudomonas aphyarum]